MIIYTTASATRASDSGAAKPTLRDIPADLIQAIISYLDRPSLLCLRWSCSGYLASSLLEESIFRKAFTLKDWEDDRLNSWSFKPRGSYRWSKFKEYINDQNRNYVKHLAMSHWHSLEDFKWVEHNLPSLVSLDLSDIKDYMWTMTPDVYTGPDNVYRWTDLARACPDLFGRLKELVLFSWTDFRTHEHVSYRYDRKGRALASLVGFNAYRYSYRDQSYAENFRLSRRIGGDDPRSGSAPEILLPICTSLRLLTIQGSSSTYPIYFTWSPFDVHQQVCQLANPIVKHAPPTLDNIAIFQSSPFLTTLLPRLAKKLNGSGISSLAIHFRRWIRNGRKSFGHSPSRISSGRFRDNEGFGDENFAACECDHEGDAQIIVNDPCDTFGQTLRHISLAQTATPSIKIRSIDSPNNAAISPFQLVNVFKPHHMRARNPDIFNEPETLQAVEWMKTTMNWQPIFAWDSLMSDDFPSNLTRSVQTLEFEDGLLESVATAFRAMRKREIPIRVMIGDKTEGKLYRNGLYENVFFAPTKKCAELKKGQPKEEMWQPCQSRYSLSYVTELIDELVINYPGEILDVLPAYGENRALATPEGNIIMSEKHGWRRFWARYGPRLSHLKKVVISVPRPIFEDWAKSKQLLRILHDPAWDVLDQDADDLMGNRYEFVKRTFFRRGHGASAGPMDLGQGEQTAGFGNVSLKPGENEARNLETEEIEDADLTTPENESIFDKFFKKAPKMKRKRDDGDDEGQEDGMEDGLRRDLIKRARHSARFRAREQRYWYDSD